MAQWNGFDKDVEIRTVKYQDFLGSEEELRAYLPADQCNQLFGILQNAQKPENRLRANQEQLARELEEQRQTMARRSAENPKQVNPRNVDDDVSHIAVLETDDEEEEVHPEKRTRIQITTRLMDNE